MKEILFKLIKRKVEFYNFLIEKIIAEKRMELIERLIGDSKVYIRNDITDLDGKDIKNSILIGCTIRNCMINEMTENFLERSVVSDFYVGTKEISFLTK